MFLHDIYFLLRSFPPYFFRILILARELHFTIFILSWYEFIFSVFYYSYVHELIYLVAFSLN
jgi:hypothetical protein